MDKEIKTLRIYNVSNYFPSISISGNSCQLNCKHCNQEYLSHFFQAKTPDSLITLCKSLKLRGVKGVLITGGCDKNGTLLHLDSFLPAIKTLHKMGLIIKLHTGFVNKELAKLIAQAGVDIASHEFVGHSKTIEEIFHIKKTPDDYVNTFSLLEEAGVPFLAPHIAIGLHYGDLLGELNALKLIKNNFKPSTISFIVFRPTKNTEMENIKPPSAGNIEKVLSYAHKLFPRTKKILGMMRPRNREHDMSTKDESQQIEVAALNNHINGIEHPSQFLIKEAERKGFKLRYINACGVLPTEYETRVKKEVNHNENY